MGIICDSVNSLSGLRLGFACPINAHVLTNPGVPETTNERIQRNIRELMRWRRMTQADLADALGESQPWLSKRLTGTTPFQLCDVDAIAAVFELSPAELLREGYGKWDRRAGGDRRTGLERRQGRPIRASHDEGPLPHPQRRLSDRMEAADAPTDTTPEKQT